MFSTSSEEYESSSGSEDWVNVFFKTFTKQLLARVDQSYISDSFNLFGLSEEVSEYEKTIRVLRGEKDASNMEKESALYFMVHQRYILTKQGLEAMGRIISKGVFGGCVRVSCRGYPLLPIGSSIQPGVTNAKLFCNCCKDVYESFGDLAKIDGCAFGPTFPNLFVLMHKQMFPRRDRHRKHVPRIFGFRIQE